MADGRNRLLSIAQAAMLCNPALCRVPFSNKKRRATRRKLSKTPWGGVGGAAASPTFVRIRGLCRRGGLFLTKAAKTTFAPRGGASRAGGFMPATNQVCQKNAYAGSAHRHNQSPPGERGNRAQPQPGCQETTHRRAGNAQQQVAKQANASIHAHHQGGKPAASAPKTSQRSSDMKIHLLCRLFCAGEWPIHAPVFLTPRGLKAEEFSYFTDRAAQGAKGISMLEGHCVGCKTVQKAWKMV